MQPTFDRTARFFTSVAIVGVDRRACIRTKLFRLFMISDLPGMAALVMEFMTGWLCVGVLLCDENNLLLSQSQ